MKRVAPPARTRRREPKAAGGRREEASSVELPAGGDAAEKAKDEATEQALPEARTTDGADADDASVSKNDEATEQAAPEIPIDNAEVAAASESEIRDEVSPEEGLLAVSLAQDPVVNEPPSDSVDEV